MIHINILDSVVFWVGLWLIVHAFQDDNYYKETTVGLMYFIYVVGYIFIFAVLDYEMIDLLIRLRDLFNYLFTFN